MPFPKQTPREFTRANIEAMDENQMGVYGLFADGPWIYIGSGDLRQRLLDHLNGDNPCITRAGPTHWADVACDDYVDREKWLIDEYHPTCNEKVG